MKNLGAIYLQRLFHSEAKLEGCASRGTLLTGAISHTRKTCHFNISKMVYCIQRKWKKSGDLIADVALLVKRVYESILVSLENELFAFLRLQIRFPPVSWTIFLFRRIVMSNFLVSINDIPFNSFDTEVWPANNDSPCCLVGCALDTQCHHRFFSGWIAADQLLVDFTVWLPSYMAFFAIVLFYFADLVD